MTLYPITTTHISIVIYGLQSALYGLSHYFIKAGAIITVIYMKKSRLKKSSDLPLGHVVNV